MATAKNRAMLLTLADLDSKLANWKSLHEVVQVHPGNANFLLLREVTVTKNPDKPGRKGVLMNYHPATQSVFIRFYGLPFGFWLPLMLREAPSDFRIVVNLQRGFLRPEAVEHLDS